MNNEGMRQSSLTNLNQPNHEIDDDLCLPGDWHDVWPIHPEGAGDDLADAGVPLVVIAPLTWVAVAHTFAMDRAPFDPVVGEAYTSYSVKDLESRCDTLE